MYIQHKLQRKSVPKALKTGGGGDDEKPATSLNSIFKWARKTG